MGQPVVSPLTHPPSGVSVVDDDLDGVLLEAAAAVELVDDAARNLLHFLTSRLLYDVQRSSILDHR